MATAKKAADPAEFFTTFFKAPKMDMTALIDAQRKNMEAMLEAQRLAFEGIKGAVERQVTLVNEQVTEFSGAASEAFSAKTPEANAGKQMEMAQAAMRANIENAREIAELTNKAGTDAFAVLQKRFTESVEEAKKLAA